MGAPSIGMMERTELGADNWGGVFRIVDGHGLIIVQFILLADTKEQ